MCFEDPKSMRTEDGKDSYQETPRFERLGVSKYTQGTLSAHR